MNQRHIPRKQFGQNFLTDPFYINACISAIRPQAADLMVEIGPGLGALTIPLLAVLKHLHVVEIDRDIVARLTTEHPAERLTVHNCDALKFDFAPLGSNLRIVGNLPYNISTPLLFHLAEFGTQVKDMHFMLQKEVVERMVAEPGGGEYGRLSVMLQHRFAMEMLFTVPGDAFHPAPKVESAFVRMIPLPEPFPAVSDEVLFQRVVAAAFSQRRKMLRNTLADWLPAAELAALQIDPTLRAENLSVADFALIANHIDKQRR
jgi:16S rRNA (adenine1518-N6/adenine1519-N6)-dimethyltransferase